MFNKYDFSSIHSDYLTPPELVASVLKSNGLVQFDCDTCCSQNNIPANFRYKIDGLYLNSGNKISDKNGLVGTWFPHNWCNPPFESCKVFVQKAIEEQKKGHTTYMLIPARTETKYWHEYILDDFGGTNRSDVRVEFLKKGVCFLAPETAERMPVFKNGLAIVTFIGHLEDSNA